VLVGTREEEYGYGGGGEAVVPCENVACDGCVGVSYVGFVVDVVDGGGDLEWLTLGWAGRVEMRFVEEGTAVLLILVLLGGCEGFNVGGRSYGEKEEGWDKGEHRGGDCYGDFDHGEAQGHTIVSRLVRVKP